MKSVIERMTRQQLRRYLRNKHVGGSNFTKGGHYENYFALWKIAEALDVYIQTQSDHTITAPAPSYFVDDLVLSKSAAEVDCFQLKNSPRASWGNGDRTTPLFDFFHQSKHLSSIPHTLNLVVPSEDRVQQLTKNRPRQLPAAANVLFFPDVELFQLIQYNHIKETLEKISKSEKPSLADLKYLSNALLSRWCGRKGSCSASYFIEPEVSRWLRSTRTSAAAQSQLRPAIRAILDAIPSLAYSVERGFFSYSYKNIRQTLLFDVFDTRFNTVQDWIQREKPSTYPGLFEEMLMTWSMP